MEENKRKRAPGGGRKPIADKIVQVDFYLRKSDLEIIGGKANLTKLIRSYLKNYINLKD